MPRCGIVYINLHMFHTLFIVVIFGVYQVLMVSAMSIPDFSIQSATHSFCTFKLFPLSFVPVLLFFLYFIFCIGSFVFVQRILCILHLIYRNYTRAIQNVIHIMLSILSLSLPRSLFLFLFLLISTKNKFESFKL